MTPSFTSYIYLTDAQLQSLPANVVVGSNTTRGAELLSYPLSANKTKRGTELCHSTSKQQYLNRVL